MDLQPVEAVRLTSLAGDFATCTERSRGPVRRLGNMFETRRPCAPLGAHGLSFLVEVGAAGQWARALFDTGLRDDVLRYNVAASFLSHGHPDHYGGLFPRGCVVDSVGTQYFWTAPARGDLRAAKRPRSLHTWHP